MTDTRAPLMPTAVDQRADVFVREFADRIAPIQHYVAATYPGDHISTSFAMLTEQEKIGTLTVITHAVELCDFPSTFAHRRAANEAMRLAQYRLTVQPDDAVRWDFRVIYAKLLGRLASALASTYVEYPTDDGCYCGQPECGAC
ncbi:MAG: hypothetical protein U1C73_03425 [Dietzia sp.]|nr:hypothetical protein [Dietzia sp.]